MQLQAWMKSWPILCRQLFKPGIEFAEQAFFTENICSIAPGNPQGIAAPLAPLLRRAADLGQISASVYRGAWVDVGTPARLAALNAV